MSETPAHETTVTIRISEYFPSHEPRETDPHYKYFNEARKTLEKAGKLVCWVCGKDGKAAGAPIQLHHNICEFALANGVDIKKFEEKFPEFNVTDQESFFRAIESEGGLLPLCQLHHTGIEGIHCLPYPIWRALAFWKDDVELPGRELHDIG